MVGGEEGPQVVGAEERTRAAIDEAHDLSSLQQGATTAGPDGRGRPQSGSTVAAVPVQQQVLERQRQRSLSRPSSGHGYAAAQTASQVAGAAAAAGMSEQSSSSTSAAVLSRPARPLLLQRSRAPLGRPFPGAACSAAARGSSSGAAPLYPMSPSAAAMAAGAIASGRPLPKNWQAVAAPSPAASAAASRDVAATLQAKLSHVERLNQHQATKLLKFNQELDRLRAENSMLHQLLQDDRDDRDDEDAQEESSGTEDLHSLRTERDQYKHQVQGMTKFLQDYGLTWVGDSDEAEGDSQLDSSQISADRPPVDDGSTVAARLSRPTSAAGCTVDIQVMTSRVEGLNAMVQKEGARIVATRVGGAVHARLVADDTMPLPITFFKDGVKLGACQFRPYDCRPAQQLIRDILDGFFPYEIKDDYPDGVHLKVVDRAGLTFKSWLQEYSSHDKDLSSGGDRLALPGGRALNVPTSPLSGSASQQVRGGNARGRGVSAPGGGGAAPAPVVVSLLEAERDPTKPVARIQVKLDEGRRIVTCMESHHTVGQLEDALDGWCTEQGIAGLRGSHLRAAFPPRTFVDREQSLADAGLMPSATLFVALEARAT